MSRDSLVIKRILRRVRWKKLIAYYRLELVPSRKGLLGWCPFHPAYEPSFRIDVRKKTFRCSACGARGDILDFVARQEDITRAEAAPFLKKVICSRY